MPTPTERTLMPGDWIEFENLINELYSRVVTEEVSLTVVQSDVTACSSNIVWMESDIYTNTSDIVVLKSDIDVVASDLLLVGGDGGSDTTTNTSDIVFLKSDTVTNTSDIVLLGTELDAVSDGVLTNASDLVLTDAILSSVSDGVLAVASDLVLTDATLSSVSDGVLTNASDLVLTDAIVSSVSDGVLKNASDLVLTDATLSSVSDGVLAVASDLVLTDATLSSVSDGVLTNASDLVLTDAELNAVSDLVVADQSDIAWMESDIDTNTSDIDILDDYTDYALSSMLLTGGTISEGGDLGTIKVGALTALLRTGTGAADPLVKITISTDTDDITLAGNDIFYNVLLTYGTPCTIATSASRGNGANIIKIGECLKETDGTRHYADTGLRLSDGVRKLHRRAAHLRTIEKDSGGVLVSETGTRNLYITAGHFHRGINSYDFALKDTSDEDKFDYYYYNPDGSAWVKDDNGGAHYTQIDIVQYNKVDTGTGLANLVSNKYTTNWVFVHPDDEHILVVYGRSNTTLTAAENESIPPSLPDLIGKMAALICKIIVRATAGTLVFENIEYFVFTPNISVDHNELQGLQGGTNDEYYHLTSAEHTLASDVAAELDAVSNLVVADQSNIVWMESDIDTNTSDIVVLKSDIDVVASDTALNTTQLIGATTQTVNLLAADSTAEKQAKIDVIPRYVPFGVEITFQFETGNTHTETAALNWIGFYGGGTLFVYGNRAEANADDLHSTQDTIIDSTTNAVDGLVFYICRVAIWVRNLKIMIQDWNGGRIVGVDQCFGTARVMNNYLLGAGYTTANHCIMVNSCMSVNCTKNYVSNTRFGITSQMGLVFSKENDDIGTKPDYGLKATQGGIIGKRNTQPTGNTADELAEYGGVIR